jgi:hypothetical protein
VRRLSAENRKKKKKKLERARTEQSPPQKKQQQQQQQLVDKRRRHSHAPPRQQTSLRASQQIKTRFVDKLATQLGSRRSPSVPALMPSEFAPPQPDAPELATLDQVIDDVAEKARRQDDTGAFFARIDIVFLLTIVSVDVRGKVGSGLSRLSMSPSRLSTFHRADDRSSDRYFDCTLHTHTISSSLF